MREIADASIACRFAQLEAGVALARALDRTLVLPSWTVMITTAPFEKLVRLCTEDELKASFSRTNTAGIAFVRVELSSMEGSGPWLDDEPDSNVNVVFKEDLSALKSQSVVNHADTHEEQLRLDAPMRTSDDVLRHLGHLDHFNVLVLASAATHRLIAPSSIINPYERRAHLTAAYRPCRRLQPRLAAFLRGIRRPYVAVRAPFAAPSAIVAEVTRKLSGTATPAVAWVSANGRNGRNGRNGLNGRNGRNASFPDVGASVVAAGAAAAVPNPTSVAAAHIDTADVIDLDGTSQEESELLRLWVCALADHFVGSCRSLDSEWIRRLRVDSGKLIDHRFLPVVLLASPPSTMGCPPSLPPPPSPPPAAATESVRPPADDDLATTRRDRQTSSWRRKKSHHHSLPAASSLRDITDLRPIPLNWAPPAELRGQELFDHFIASTLPAVRRLPFRAAIAGTSERVAFIIEPRRHPALEHVVRNVAHFLGDGWQMQIFHGTANSAYVRSLFSAEEIERIQLVSLQVDNLGRDAYSELLCSHWLWTHVAAETALLFQTDALLCRGGIERFGSWDYIGAPWDTREVWCADHEWLHDAGNGGLTIRSKSASLAALDAVDYSCGAPEDLYFVETFPRIGRMLAPREEARRFSVESPLVEDGGPGEGEAEPPVGMHAAYKFLPHERTVRLLQSIALAYAQGAKETHGTA